MRLQRLFFGLVAAWVFGFTFISAGDVTSIPPALKPWGEWAVWNDVHRLCPTPYSDPKTHRCFWPSRLDLQVGEAGGKFSIEVTVFHPTWVPLPGGGDAWPQGVRVAGAPGVVVERDGVPSVRLAAGTFSMGGEFRWVSLPQTLRIPAAVGLLSLTREGQVVEAPAWDAQGLLWLRRDGVTGAAERDFLSVKLFAALEDGIPLWWRQEIELTVAGKSREEDLGTLLPEGWQLASVEAAIPVTVDGGGRMRVQARAGKWTLRASAFRLDNPKELRFAPGTKPSSSEELVAFRARPDFRVLEVMGAPSIDVSQTFFPAPWRELPVYRWETGNPLRLVERMRGMGDQKPAGLGIERTLWLDEGGRGWTFRDRITGQMQQVWRLDAAEGEELGSVRSGGVGQLVTRNPLNQAIGVELRSRNLDVEATGRVVNSTPIAATGWRSDAESVRVTLHLPPGWRLFALTGVDWVEGDWLTAWTLLDLFLLLIFSLAVYRLRGWATALLAFAAFGLAYHEPGAPRYLWLLLLVPIAMVDRVPEGVGRTLIRWGQLVLTGVLLFFLVPFITRQVQQALYPQLELTRQYPQPGPEDGIAPVERAAQTQQVTGLAQNVPARAPAQNQALNRFNNYTQNNLQVASMSLDSGGNAVIADNLRQDSKARIQTGPGLPEWTWRAVSFGWNGPVRASQEVRPILVPDWLERVLTVLRTVLLAGLAAALLRGFRLPTQRVTVSGTAVALMAFFLSVGLTGSARAQGPVEMGPIPDAALLEKLRERLLEVPDVHPNAASISSVVLTLDGKRLKMDAEIHAAIETAVPLPGKLPSFSPVSVSVDGRPATSLRRDDGFLWVVLPAGVHAVRVEGSLQTVSEWEWTYLLRPRHVRIEAPDWTVAGLRPNGVPEQQVFFAPKQKSAPTAATAASYERQELQAIVAVDRQLEIGLQWQVRSVVTRLSPAGKAVSLRIPLLPGENVVSPGVVVRDGFVEVRLGAQDAAFGWDGSLAPVPGLKLSSGTNDVWIERWHLLASPVWNVGLSGLPPVFEVGNAELVPVWQPWPGESVTLAITRPTAISGATVTVNKAIHSVNLGRRQRASRLDLAIRCSLGEDFSIELPIEAEVTQLKLQGHDIPVRKDGSKLVVPLKPGEQVLSVSWKENVTLGVRSGSGTVRLPVDSANIQTSITVGQDRWVLWTRGPRRGPAVRFWVIVFSSLLGAAALSRLPQSPLRWVEWLLLIIGLTQVPLLAAAVVIAWFFLLRWRATPAFQRLSWWTYDGAQAVVAMTTVASVGVLLCAVGEGLLGNPKMFILGNGSTQTVLRWFQARSEAVLPSCQCFSVSIWWYRVLMLLWALWLAFALLRWLGAGWKTFSSGGFLRSRPKIPSSTVRVDPPPLPGSPTASGRS